MAKATSLTPDALVTPTPTPTAATPPRHPKAKMGKSPMDTPLQIRLPRKEVKAIKVAAAEAEQSISEYMLACVHACNGKRQA